MEEFSEDGDLDGAGGREDFVGVRGEGVSVCEVENLDAEDTVESVIGFVNGGVEFLEEEPFFLRKRLLSGDGQGAGKANRKNGEEQMSHGRRIIQRKIGACGLRRKSGVGPPQSKKGDAVKASLNHCEEIAVRQRLRRDRNVWS